MRRKAFFIISILLILSLPLFSTDYYVKNGGDDVKDGQSDANAWATIAKVNSVSFNPSDNIYLKKGSSWREMLNTPSAGTSGNQITFGSYGTGANPLLIGSIDYDSAGSWSDIGGNKWATANSSFTATPYCMWYDTNSTPQFGKEVSGSGDLDTNWEWWYDSTNDRVVIYHDVGNPADQTNGLELGDPSHSYGILITKNYITINGIDVKFSRWDSVHATSAVNAGLEVKNCTVTYSGYSGIYCNGTIPGLLIDGNTMSHIRNAGFISIDLTTGTISNNTITYVCRKGLEKADAWGTGIDISEASGVIVDGNYIEVHTLAAEGFSSSVSSGGIGGDNNNSCIIQNNECSYAYYGGIDMSGGTGGGKTCNNNIIRYNICHHNTSGGIFIHGSAVQTSVADSNEVYYNICYSNKHGLAIIDDANSNTFYNNTLYENEYNIFFYTPNEGTAEPSNNILKNNISYNTVNQHVWFGGISSNDGNVLDYNCYFNDHSSSFGYNGTTYSTFSAYQTGSGQDANSLGDTNPQFVDPENQNFYVQPFSTCIDNGASVGLSQDYYGNSVPYNSVVDIGVHEYQGSGESDGSCPESFTHFKKITVQGDNLSNDQSNVPVLMVNKSGGDTDIGDGTDSIEDIWFYTDADPPVKLSWDSIYYNNAAGTATFIYAVNCSPLADGSYKIRAYYGNKSASDGSDSDGTYNSNYKAVYHMDAASGNESDSSGNSNTLTDYNTVGSGTGKIRGGRDFEESNNEALYITDGNQTGLDITGDFSASMWINPEAFNNTYNTLLAKFYTIGQRSYRWYIKTSDQKLYFNYSDDLQNTNELVSTSTVSTGSLQHVAISVDVSAKSCIFWFDGSSESGTLNSGNETSIANSTADFALGCYQMPSSSVSTQHYDGIQDEIRIYAGLYPTGWVAFEHANMNETDNELTWGAEQSCSGYTRPGAVRHGFPFAAMLILPLMFVVWRRHHENT